MSDPPASTLKLTELRELCRQHSLMVSGKKSDLVARLLDAGVEPVEVGIKTSKPKRKETDASDEGEALFLEEEVAAIPTKKAGTEVLEAEIADAEVIEAEVIEAEVIEAEIALVEEKQPELAPIPGDERRKKPTITTERSSVMSVVLVIILLGAAGWWYFSGEIEPFTPDPVRYGDRMVYTVSDGHLSVDGEFVERVVEYIDTEDDICRLTLTFSGTGDVAITSGGAGELNDQSNENLLGAVKQRGGYGLQWLTVEKTHNHDFNDVQITRYLKSVIDQNKCNEHGATSAGNSLDLTTTTWMEVQQQEMLRSQVDYDLVHEKGRVEGTVTSFGLSGVFSSIEKVQSAVAVAFAPIELKEVIGDTLIQEGSTGSRMGWSWTVLGSEEKAGAPAWRIYMENEDIKDLCLGYAHISVWAQSGSPWAIFQEVDIRISGHDRDRSECSTTSQLINDLVVPEGSLELRMTMQRSSVERGERPVIYGRDYDNRPRNSDTKIDDDRIQWGEEGTHLPDNSSRRTHPLEMAVDCIPHLTAASGAKTALGGTGYVFRALDNRSDGGPTTWNVSWVDSDDMSGWVRLDVAGAASAENCTYLNSGTYEDGPQHDRSDIPSTPDLAWMENRLLDASRYPELSTGEAWVGTSAGYHDDVRYGHLVATAGSGLDQITQWFDFDDGAGAITVDLSRTWQDGSAENSFKLAADLNAGRLIGWSYSSSV